MDNRRPTTTDNSPRPYNRTNNYRNEGDRNYRNEGDRGYRSEGDRPNGSAAGGRRFEPRDNRFPPRSNSGGGDRFQSRDSRPPSRTGDNRYQSRDNRNQPREADRFQSRDARGGGGGQPREVDRFQSRGGGSGDRFAPRGERFQPRGGSGGRFAPRGGSGGGYKPWEREQQEIRIVSDMQVTDGKHRGKYLQSTASERVRPTARRIREVMFRILYRRIRAGRFLDLCAGAGTVGIEAISRGALIGTFVERSAKMCGFIKKNLAACDIKEGHGEIHEIEVVPFLKRMMKRRRFWDVVYFDPPYDSNYDEVLAYFERGAAIKPGGVLIIEHHVEMFFPEEIGRLRRWRVVTQGDTSLSFYERR